MNPFTYYRLKDFPFLMVVAGIYFLIAYINTLHFSSIGMPVAVVRPQVGFALGLLLLAGKRYVLAIFIGSFANRLVSGYGVFNSLLFALGTSVSVFFGTWLLTRDKKFDFSIPSLNDFFRLLLLAGLMVVISSLMATLALFDTNILNDHIFRNITLRWWMGDTLGIILITPVVLVCSQFPRQWLQKRLIFEMLLFFTLAFLVGQSVFLGWFADTFGQIARGYWIFLFVVWGATRLGTQSVALVLCMTMIQGLWGAKLGKGFFGTDIAQTQLSNYWFYMLILSMVGMGLAATVNAFKKAEEEIRQLAHHDALTGLANRLILTDHINQAIATAKRSKNQRFAVIFHDLDKFKPVNDDYGHQIGDLLLIEVARRIKHCVREVDTVARIGGDEFVILLPIIKETQVVINVAERIHLALLQPFKIQNFTINISTSMGIAIYPEHGLNEEILLINADNAMYFAKQNGRNKIQTYFTGMSKINQRN